MISPFEKYYYCLSKYKLYKHKFQTNHLVEFDVNFFINLKYIQQKSRSQMVQFYSIENEIQGAARKLI